MRSTMVRRGVGGVALVDVTVVITLAVIGGGGHGAIPLHVWNFLLVVGAVATIVWALLVTLAQAAPGESNSSGGGEEYLRGVRDGMGPL